MEERGSFCDRRHFRQPHMTLWPRCHPALWLRGPTDHWSKMKTRRPCGQASSPAAAEMEKGAGTQTFPLLVSRKMPPWDCDWSGGMMRVPQNLPEYRNEYNDRARRGFRYWLLEDSVPKYRGYSLGAYKMLLGLPRV
ncbi:hypothetical protein GN956_G5840 [Arapaima gigas]